MEGKKSWEWKPVLLPLLLTSCLGLARLPAFPPSSPNGRNKREEAALG